MTCRVILLFSIILFIKAQLYSFGANHYGQLGADLPTSRVTPAQIPNLRSKHLSCGWTHSIVTTPEGATAVFGENQFGQLGLNHSETVTEPTRLKQNGTSKSAAGESHTVYVTDNGDAYSFGNNEFGQLGLGDMVRSTRIPMRIIQPVVLWKDVSVGSYHSILLSRVNKVYAMGGRNADHICLGNRVNVAIPTLIVFPGGVSIVKTSSNLRHNLFIDEDGNVWSCGNNADGQLGRPPGSDTLPGKIPGFSNISAIACGHYHSLIITADTGLVYSFGRNSKGQLGLGDTVSRKSPEQILAFGNAQIVTASCGGDHCLVVDKNDKVWTWGVNNFGQLGLNDFHSRFVPTLIRTISGQKLICTGWRHSLIGSPSGVYSCGLDNKGQLGLGGQTDIYHSVASILTDQIAMCSSRDHSVCSMENGQVYAWGSNEHGQLGVGDIRLRGTPTRVLGLESIKIVAVGSAHSLFLSVDGILFSCGDNENGQLGLGHTSPAWIPQRIQIEGKVQNVVAGRRHSLALTTNGTVYSFGSNEFGQLGLGDTNYRSSPVIIQMNDSCVATGISAGNEYTFVICSDNTLYSMGRNEYGQLGLNRVDLQFSIPRL
jgi:alpha-tubulin suppressor-like RCC1 family protein